MGFGGLNPVEYPEPLLGYYKKFLTSILKNNGYKNLSIILKMTFYCKKIFLLRLIVFTFVFIRVLTG